MSWRCIPTGWAGPAPRRWRQGAGQGTLFEKECGLSNRLPHPTAAARSAQTAFRPTMGQRLRKPWRLAPHRSRRPPDRAWPTAGMGFRPGHSGTLCRPRHGAGARQSGRRQRGGSGPCESGKTGRTRSPLTGEDHGRSSTAFTMHGGGRLPHCSDPRNSPFATSHIAGRGIHEKVGRIVERSQSTGRMFETAAESIALLLHVIAASISRMSARVKKDPCSSRWLARLRTPSGDPRDRRSFRPWTLPGPMLRSAKWPGGHPRPG